MSSQQIDIEIKDLEIESRSTVFPCFHRTRFIILIQSLSLLTIIFANIVCWNPAMIALVDITSSPLYSNNSNLSHGNIDFNDASLPISDRRIPYSTLEKSMLIGAIYFGALAGVVPMNFLLQKWGTYKTMLTVGLISVITTALTPFAAVTNFYFLVIVRTIQGTTFSNPYPIIGSITNIWSSLKENGFFVSVLTGFLQLAATFTIPVSGIIASNG